MEIVDESNPFESAMIADGIVGKVLRRIEGSITSLEVDKKITEHVYNCNVTTLKDIFTLTLLTHDTQPIDQDWSPSEEPVN